MTIIEFVHWPASKELLSNVDDAIAPTVKSVSSADGCEGIYYGLKEEDKDKFWMAVVWKTIGHHQTMMKSAGYPVMLDKLKPYTNGDLQMFHVEFNKDFKHAFTSPMTHLVLLEAKEGRAAEGGMRQLLDKCSKECSATFGPKHEEPGDAVVIAGLESDQAKLPAVCVAHFDELGKFAHVEQLHVKFKHAFGAQ